MHLLKVTRPGNIVLLASVIAIFLTAITFIGGRVPANAQAFLIDLSQPNTVSTTVLGATLDDHLSGNGTPDDFSDLTRARAIATGDFNDDGIPDVAIGAPEADPTLNNITRTDAGAVYIIFGRQTPFPAIIDTLPPAVNQPNVRIFGAAAGDSNSADHLGFALAAGDVNGDGNEDLIIGAPGANFPGSANPPVAARQDTGAVFIIFSSANLVTGTTIDLGINNAAAANVAIYGVGTDDRFGSSLASENVGGPLVGQNPADDVLAGAPANQGPDPTNNARAGGGAAYTIFGGAGFNPPQGGATRIIDLNNVATPPNVIVFGRAGDALGSSVAIGNVNAGASNDLLTGAPGSDRPALVGPAPVPAANDTGATFVFFGGGNLVPGAGATKIFDVNSAVAQQRPSVSIFGAEEGDRLGASVATGDVTGDGNSDINIGAPDEDGPPNNPRENSGTAYVMAGGANLNPPVGTVERRIDLLLPNTFVSLTVFGEAAGDRFGSTVITGSFNLIGNSDFVTDLFVGSPGAQGNKGTVSMFFGGPNLTFFNTRDLAVGQDDVRIIGQADGDELGWAMATADIDNNRGGDLIAGAPFADVTGRANAGEAYILLAANNSVPPINLDPTVEVTAPNGGEGLQGGTNFNITWTASDPDGDNTIQRFEIRLSTDSGATFNTIIADNVAGTARSFLWAVPQGVITTTARIRITVFDNADGQAQDDSDDDFSITGFVVVNLLTPNGGENLKFGQVFQITWNVPDVFANQIRGFDLFLSIDSGANFNIPIQFDPINPAIGPGIRTFNWTVPNDPSLCTDNARVLIIATSLIGVRSPSFSGADFSITGVGPTVNVNNMGFNDARTKIIFKTSQPAVGSEITFAQGTLVEISTDAQGTTFISPNKINVKPSLKKIKIKGAPNNQTLGAFFPDGAIRIIRITNPPCGITELRVQRQGGTLVQIANP